MLDSLANYDGTGPEGATFEFITMGPAARN